MMSRPEYLLRFLNCLLIVYAGCFPASKRPFISVQNGGLREGERPYYFAGTNFWYGSYLGSPGKTGDRDRLERELDALCELGLTNLRILGGSERSYMSNMLSPALQPSPGQYDEELLQGLDYLLSEMAERDMRAVVFLTNYWEWSGGMAQYVVWSEGLEKGPDPQDPGFDWADFMDFSARFYGDSLAQNMYRTHISRLITRVNTVTGETYADDPTIMAWELANEPRPGTVSDAGEKNLPAFFTWIDSTAHFIKTLDPNHLVTTGSEGIIGSLLSSENFLRAHASPAVDYLTVHVWPYNWKWFDPNDIAATIDSAEIKATSYIQQHFDLARTLGKPLVLEEFGLARDSARTEPGSPVTARDRYFRTLLQMVYDSAAAGAPIAGSNFWAWSGEGTGRNIDGRWHEGDPLLGDPPHEPQGINSVFISDRGTLLVLKEHAMRMAGLCTRSQLKIISRNDRNGRIESSQRGIHTLF